MAQGWKGCAAMTEFRGPGVSDGSDDALGGLWALINAAQHRLLVLALARDDGALWSEAALVLGTALAELEYVEPALPGTAEPGGWSTSSGPSPDSTAAIGELLDRVLDLAGRAIHSGSPCRARMLGLARTVQSIDAARHFLAGQVA
jgi:hypothetical protein